MDGNAFGGQGAVRGGGWRRTLGLLGRRGAREAGTVFRTFAEGLERRLGATARADGGPGPAVRLLGKGDGRW